MPNTQKLENVEKLKEKVQRAKSIIFANYHGLDANQANELRSKVSESGAEMTVAKNTLLKIALEENNIDSSELERVLEGPTAAVFSFDDAIAPIKALTEYAKKTDLPQIKAGIVDGQFTSAVKIKILSELPSREELLAKLVRGMKSPISGIVNVLGGPQRKFVYVISAIAKEKEKGVS